MASGAAGQGVDSPVLGPDTVTSPPRTVSYRRVGTDGSVVICGVYYLRHQERADEATAAPPCALPACVGEEMRASVNEWAASALAQCRKSSDLSFVSTVIEQLKGAFHEACSAARSLHTTLVAQHEERRGLKACEQTMPVLADKLLAALAETQAHQKRVADLEAELARLAPPPSVAAVTPAPPPPPPPAASAAAPDAAAAAVPHPHPPPREAAPASTGHAKWVRARNNEVEQAVDDEERRRRQPPQRPASGVGTAAARTLPHLSRLTRTFGCTEDIRQYFEEVDVQKAGWVSMDAATAFFRSVDDYGVPRRDAVLQEVLRQGGGESGRVYFPGVLLLLLLLLL